MSFEEQICKIFQKENDIRVLGYDESDDVIQFSVNKDITASQVRRLGKLLNTEEIVISAYFDVDLSEHCIEFKIFQANNDEV